MRTLKERIAIEQALEDGKQIDIDGGYNGEYLPLNISEKDHYAFNWRSCDYRIKPEPRVRYMNLYDDKFNDIAHKTEEDAIKYAGPGCAHKAVKFIEVLD